MAVDVDMDGPLATVGSAVADLPPELLPVLRAQILAFRLLSKGAPVPKPLLDALDPAHRQGGKGKENEGIVGSGLARVPLDLLETAQRTEKLVRARVNARVVELDAVPAAISAQPFGEDPAVMAAVASGGVDPSLATSSAKIQATIEVKALRLLEKQRRLREEVVRCLNPPSVLATAVDRRQFMYPGKHRPDDVRQPAFARFPGGDRREKISQADFIASITQHSRELRDAGSARRDWFGRLGQQVLKMHAQIEKDEAARIEMDRSERLRALRENDEETYLRLVKESKDTRVQYIMQQTTDFLRKLTDKVAQQQETVELDEPESPVEEATTVRDADKSDFYGLAHKIVEPVTRQPAMLQGGELKEYQLKGLQWMVSLYNNRLNGILADEMGLGELFLTSKGDFYGF